MNFQRHLCVYLSPPSHARHPVNHTCQTEAWSYWSLFAPNDHCKMTTHKPKGAHLRRHQREPELPGVQTWPTASKLFKASVFSNSHTGCVRGTWHMQPATCTYLLTSSRPAGGRSLLPHSSDFKEGVNRKLCKCGDIFKRVMTKHSQAGQYCVFVLACCS